MSPHSSIYFLLLSFFDDNLISWSSKRQPTFFRSSAEAEYRDVANMVSKSCWLHNHLLELHFPIFHTTLVYYVNVSSIYHLEILSNISVHNTLRWTFILFGRRSLIVKLVFFMFLPDTKLLISSTKTSVEFSWVISKPF